MEGNFKIWEEILKTIATMTSWPVVVLYLALLFRQALTKQIPTLFRSFEALIERLAKVKYKGVEAEFEIDKLRETAAEHSSELTKELLIKVETQFEQPIDKPADE